MAELIPWEASRGAAPRDVAPAVIEAAFAERGVAAPPAYVEFVRAHGGKRFKSGHNEVIDAHGRRVGLGTIYHHDSAQPRYHIADLWAQVADEVEDRIVPLFSTDYSGLVCLDYREAPTDPAVVTFDFEAIPDQRIVRLADRFEQLLKKLDGPVAA